MAFALRFVHISEQAATFPLYAINWLIFITVGGSVYSAVRTDSLYKTDYVPSLKGKLHLKLIILLYIKRYKHTKIKDSCTEFDILCTDSKSLAYSKKTSESFVGLYRIFSNLISTSFCRFLKRKKI